MSLAELGPGDYFGEMSLLTGNPSIADVVAVEPFHPAFKLSPDIGRVPLNDPARAHEGDLVGHAVRDHIGLHQVTGRVLAIRIAQEVNATAFLDAPAQEPALS